jgi:hypothetical protein
MAAAVIWAAPIAASAQQQASGNGPKGATNQGGGMPHSGGTSIDETGDGKPVAASMRDLSPQQLGAANIVRDPNLDRMNMRLNVTKLATYAEELKKEVLKTDTTKVLSVEMIKKTEDIEKLAHQIAMLAKA